MESPEALGFLHTATSASAATSLIDALHAERVVADRERLMSLLVAADVPRQRTGW